MNARAAEAMFELAVGLVISLLLALLPASAFAGRPVYHRADFPDISESACPTGSPGVDSEGYYWGISLAGLRGFQVVVCPDTGGAHLTGVGTMDVCLYSPTPWGAGSWAISTLQWDLTDKSTTTDNPCLALDQLQPVVSLSDRVFVKPSTDFGVSVGGVKVYLYGETQ